MIQIQVGGPLCEEVTMNTFGWLACFVVFISSGFPQNGMRMSRRFRNEENRKCIKCIKSDVNIEVLWRIWKLWFLVNIFLKYFLTTYHI